MMQKDRKWAQDSVTSFVDECGVYLVGIINSNQTLMCLKMINYCCEVVPTLVTQFC